MKQRTKRSKRRNSVSSRRSKNVKRRTIYKKAPNPKRVIVKSQRIRKRHPFLVAEDLKEKYAIIALNKRGYAVEGNPWNSGDNTFFVVRKNMKKGFAVPLWVNNEEEFELTRNAFKAYMALMRDGLAPHFIDAFTFTTTARFLPRCTLIITEEINGTIEMIQPMSLDQASFFLPKMLDLAVDAILHGIWFESGPDATDFVWKGDINNLDSVKVFIAPYPSLSFFHLRFGQKQLTSKDIIDGLDGFFDYLNVNFDGGVVKRGSGMDLYYALQKHLKERLHIE